MKKYRIKDYSYFADILFVVGTEEELIEYQQETFKDGDIHKNSTIGTGKHVWVEPMEHWILLPQKGRLDAWQEASLAHEVLHLTFSVLGNAGVKYSQDSEEAFTYYFQSKFAECLKKLFQFST